MAGGKRAPTSAVLSRRERKGLLGGATLPGRLLLGGIPTHSPHVAREQELWRVEELMEGPKEV